MRNTLPSMGIRVPDTPQDAGERNKVASVDPSKVFGVSIHSVPPNISLPFDVSVIVADKLTRIRSAGDMLTSERLKDLNRHHVKMLYVPLDQRGTYKEFLWTQMVDPKHSIEQRTASVGQATYLQVEELYTAKDLNPVVERTVKLLKHIGQLAAGTQSFTKLAGSLSHYESPAYEHSVNVAVYAMTLFRHASETTAENVWQVGIAGLLHDLGEQAGDVKLLQFPERMTKEQFEAYKQHPRRCLEMLKGVENLPSEIANTILQHHENCDGSGFPDQLKGNQISLGARVLSICDTYENLTNPIGSQQSGLTPLEAVQLMGSVRPERFDQKLLKVLIDKL